MSSTPIERIDELERRLARMQLDLADLRRTILAEEAVRAEEPEPLPPVPVEAPAPAPASAPSPDPVPAPALEWYERSHDLKLSDLLGARALAWAGGIVTVLGIVFFFALAVNRGWIGPGARVAFGALASAIVFGGGLYLRRRFGETYASLSAVGAGLAGGYATLIAAGPHYHLLPDWGALTVAAAIAGVGLAAALVWSSEFVAGLGLVGAMLAQIPIAWGNGLTTTGTGFAALMFGAAAAVVVARRWQKLLTIAAVAVAPQVLILATQHLGDARAGDLAVAAACAAVFLAAGVGLQLRAGADLRGYPASIVIAGGVLASLSAGLLIAASTAEGGALLGVAAVYAALAAAFFGRPGNADLSALLAAVALAIGAVAVADLLSGPSLAIAWSAEAAVLAWLARRIGESRYQLASLAYLLLAIGHAIAIDAPPRHLFVESANPSEGVVAVIAAAVAATVFAERCPTNPFHHLYERDWAFAAGWIAGIGALYAASLGLLELPSSFAWNQVAVSGLLAYAALAALVVGLLRRWRAVQLGAGLALTLALAKDVGFDLIRLDAPQRSWAMVLVGSALLLAGFFYARLNPEQQGLDPLTAAAVGASLPLGIAAVFDLLDGSWHGIDRAGAALLAIAAVYGGLAAVAFPHRRLRDLSTQLWGNALLVVAPSTALLVSDTPLALTWAGIGALLALLSRWKDEARFQAGAAAYLALAVGHAFIFDSPPTVFFESNRHPGSGAGAVAGAAAAALVLALLARIPEALKVRVSRTPVFALAGVLATYAGSLVVLELFELGGGRIETRFERGHTAVSALWGVLGLLLLYLGLTRRRSLRLAGFALFGVTLAKIFLYDLATLSPVARALSFLAVGAVLLLGGFFYQRLSVGALEREEGRRSLT